MTTTKNVGCRKLQVKLHSENKGNRSFSFSFSFSFSDVVLMKPFLSFSFTKLHKLSKWLFILLISFVINEKKENYVKEEQ